MLVRINSGEGGAGEYFELGRKKGREFERDLIDERLTLAGNLALTEAIIDGMETAQDGDSKYLHITLGFAEDFSTAQECSDNEVNLATIQRVTDAYRDMLMAAYDPAEYAFYAEAHIPKVTHEINESSGEYVKRLPHVHIIIPMRNLESGKYLNPLGYGKANLDYNDAIQEKINADFKLRSPKESMREEIGATHPLAKHNTKFKEQTPKQVKESVHAMIATGQIRTFEELAKVAEQYGEVKIRQGKDGDYINVKPSWADKGINLKTLTRQNFQADADAIRGTATPSKDYDGIVEHWKTRAALEARYVTSGNRHIYKDLDEQGKAELLTRKQRETKARLTPQPEHVNPRPAYEDIKPEQCARLQRAANLHQSDNTKARPGMTSRSLASLQSLANLPMVYRQDRMPLQPDTLDRLGAALGTGPKLRWSRVSESRTVAETRRLAPIAASTTPPQLENINERPDYENIKPEQCTRLRLAANLHQSVNSKALRRTKAESLASLRNLSSLPMVYERRSASMLLQPNASNRLGAADRAGNEVRRSGAGTSRNDEKGRRKFVDTTLTVPATLQKLSTPKGIAPDKLKNETSPSIVLSDAERRFGIKLSDYTITSAKDGTPRIRHQDKHYNLGDFYTKHIGIAWAKAQPILAECYHATLSNGLPPPDKELWKSFSAWRDRDYLEAKTKKDATRIKLREQLVKARNEYKSVKINSQGAKRLVRQSILARARAEHLIKVTEIRQQQKQAAEEAKRPSRNAQYRKFLNDLASEGNLPALGELRRMAPPETEVQDTISGGGSQTVLPLPSYKIDHNGKVTYFKDSTAIVTDSVKGVAVLTAETNSYDIALKVAVARYGKDLTFNGDQLFMKNMIDAAKRSGMDLVIRNADKPREAPIVIQKPSKGFSR